MLEGLRNQVVVLSCQRHGLSSHQGRGVDQLPPSVLAQLADTLPAHLDSAALAAAYTTALELLAQEAEHLDPALITRLRKPFATLGTTARVREDGEPATPRSALRRVEGELEPVKNSKPVTECAPVP